MQRANRITLLACLLTSAACAAEPTDSTGSDPSVGSAQEDLTLSWATPLVASPRIEETGTQHITISYPCGGPSYSLWRSEGGGAYRKVADLSGCRSDDRGRYTDDTVRPVSSYCYRLGTRTAPYSKRACGRTRYVPCNGEGRPWRTVSCGSSDGCTVRVPPGSCLDLTAGEVKLDPRASYDGVEIRIRRSDVTLDCQGATLAGPYADGTGIVVESPITVEFDGEPAACGEPTPAGLCRYNGEEAPAFIENVTVRNCTIDGYERGARVRLTSAWSAHVREVISDAYESRFRHPNEQMCRVTQLEDCLREAAPREVTFDRVHIRDSAGDGLSLQSYVHHVTFQNGSVHDAGGVGAYVTYGSRQNVIRSSSFRDNGREGIALDASAFNVISGNTLAGNSKRLLPEWEQPYGQAITILRNAWENRWPEPSGSAPRVQHAEGNRIENNEISDHQQAIWIGFRQSVGRHSSEERGDPVYYSEDGTIPSTTLRYYRKNAEDTIVRFNNIYDCESGVIVDDDRAQLIGNWFSDPKLGGTRPAISIGNRIRRKAREPVYGAVVDGNVFAGDFRRPISIHDCAYGTRVSDNFVLEGGTWTPVDARVSRCDGSQAMLVAHLTDSTGAVATRSFAQRGGFFDDRQTWLAGDVDDDGLDDVVSVQASDDGRVRIWLHVAAGDGFEHKSSFQTFEPVRLGLLIPWAFEWGRWLVGDFDGVPGDDLAYLYGHEETRVRIWPALGRGFRDPIDQPLAATPFTESPPRWMAGDVDGDGRADIVQVGDDGGDARVTVHRSLGGGRFSSAWLDQVIGAFDDAHRFLLGDIDADRRADLVRVFAGGDGKAMAWAQRSTGTRFEHAWLTHVSSTGTAAGALVFAPYQQWLLADVDGDRRDDLVAVVPVSGNTVVFKARSRDGGLTHLGTDLLRTSSGDHVWLSGRFDCGSREDFVSVGPATWGAVTEVVASSGPACREVLPVGGIATAAGTFLVR